MEKYAASRMANRYTRIFDAGGFAPPVPQNREERIDHEVGKSAKLALGRPVVKSTQQHRQRTLALKLILGNENKAADKHTMACETARKNGNVSDVRLVREPEHPRDSSKSMQGHDHCASNRPGH